MRLFEERFEEFRYLGRGEWLIPSVTVAGRLYEVRVGRRGERCECLGYYHYGHCSHVTAATIARAKTVTCSCCGERLLRRFTTEVREENYDGLCWFPGDRLCGDCIKAGFWS